jgi:hypothetical protein
MPREPQVLDAQGAVLEVGSRVERAFSGFTGGLLGEVDAIKSDGLVWVTWNRCTRLRSNYRGERRFSLRRSYRCPDLLITTAKEKNDAA